MADKLPIGVKIGMFMFAVAVLVAGVATISEPTVAYLPLID